MDWDVDFPKEVDEAFTSLDCFFIIRFSDLLEVYVVRFLLNSRLNPLLLNCTDYEEETFEIVCHSCTHPLH